MAEQFQQGHANNETTKEHGHGGCFDFMINKEGNRNHEDLIVMTTHDLDAAKDHHTKQEKEKHTLLDELQRTHTHSTSSSDEDVLEEGGERKKKKKKGLGLKEAINDKLPGQLDKETQTTKDHTSVPIIEICGETAQPEEKKGFLEKIKEKLPGQHKKVEEDNQIHPPAACEHSEKKGIMDKIKEKLPGHHKNNENELV